MPDPEPVSLLRLSFRLALWLITGFAVTVAVFMTALAIGSMDVPSDLFRTIGKTAMVAAYISPLVLAFIFGRRVRHRHGLPAAQAAMVALGGLGLVILYFEINILWDLYTGVEEPDLGGFTHLAGMMLLVWTLTAAAGGLGSWWEGRTASARAGRPPRGNGSVVESGG